MPVRVVTLLGGSDRVLLSNGARNRSVVVGRVVELSLAGQAGKRGNRRDLSHLRRLGKRVGGVRAGRGGCLAVVARIGGRVGDQSRSGTCRVALAVWLLDR